MRQRILGFILSLILTFGIYFIALQPQLLGLENRLSIILILALAILQAIAQVIFFLDVWREKGTFWNLSIFISTLSIIVIIIAFSMWVMDSLNSHMMP